MDDDIISEKLIVIDSFLAHIEYLLTQHPLNMWTRGKERQYAQGWNDALMKVRAVIEEAYSFVVEQGQKQ